MKTYSSKANANRAAKNQGLKDYIISQNANGWFIDLFNEAEAENQAAKVKELHLESVAKKELEIAEWKQKFIDYNPQLLLSYTPIIVKQKDIEIKRESSVKNPVKMVWQIADEMWGQSRSVIIKACVDAGIAYNTARTQYQAFYQIKKMEGAK